MDYLRLKCFGEEVCFQSLPKIFIEGADRTSSSKSFQIFPGHHRQAQDWLKYRYDLQTEGKNWGILKTIYKNIFVMLNCSHIPFVLPHYVCCSQWLSMQLTNTWTATFWVHSYDIKIETYFLPEYCFSVNSSIPSSWLCLQFSVEYQKGLLLFFTSLLWAIIRSKATKTIGKCSIIVI